MCQIYFMLSEIEVFIDSQSFNSLIIGGGFNVDFSRVSNNSLSLSDFMSSLNLSVVDYLFPSLSFVYMHDDGSATSWVDHFLCSEQLVSSFFSVSLGGSGSNRSDHHPLVAVFNCSFNVTPNSASASSSSTSQSKPSIAWHRASPDQVYLLTVILLFALSLLLQLKLYVVLTLTVLVIYVC